MYETNEDNKMYYIDLIKLLFDKSVESIAQLDISEDILYIEEEEEEEEEENHIDNKTKHSIEEKDKIKNLKIKVKTSNQPESTVLIKRNNRIMFYNCEDGDGMFLIEYRNIISYMAVGVDEKCYGNIKIEFNNSQYLLDIHNVNIHFIKSLRESLTYINKLPGKTFKICFYDKLIESTNPIYELSFNQSDFSYDGKNKREIKI